MRLFWSKKKAIKNFWSQSKAFLVSCEVFKLEKFEDPDFKYNNIFL